MRATTCYICGKGGFKKPGEAGDSKEHVKVRDHDHLTGEYRGAAHSGCNLRYRIYPDQVKCFFHNLHGYDAHLILSAVKRCHGKLNCIPSNSEQYVSFSIDNIIFKDSQQFLLRSIADLTKSK